MLRTDCSPKTVPGNLLSGCVTILINRLVNNLWILFLWIMLITSCITMIFRIFQHNMLSLFIELSTFFVNLMFISAFFYCFSVFYYLPQHYFISSFQIFSKIVRQFFLYNKAFYNSSVKFLLRLFHCLNV